MTRKKLLIAGAVVIVLAAIAYANFAFKRTDNISVTAEKIERRDLEAVVSASGKIQPKKSVNISAETMGKVVHLRVEQGDIVKAGQPLLEIDPKNLESQLNQRQASLDTAKSTLVQTKAQVNNSRVALKTSEDTLARQDLQFKAGLLSRQEFERAQSDVETQRTNLQVSLQSVQVQEQRIKQEEANLASAQYDLNKVRIVSPIDGLVTARNVEEGETAVVGTMNNAGTVLLTVADLSVIETELEVDETDIPYVKLGQSAKITIDALQDQTFTGKVTEVGNSPIATAGATTRATNFKVKVTIDGRVPNVRPGFTCTAVITTATREKAVSVPIQAMTVRERIANADGSLVPVPVPPPGSRAKPSVAATSDELKPGQTRKEIEGVFVIRDGRSLFVPVKSGIAGEKYFEVLEGLKEGDQVVTGPFQSVRGMQDGDAVKITTAAAAATPKS
ncbi:MAG: efflux RND transporter periplasmic adaptor subunit [Burkholderiales bacterium]